MTGRKAPASRRIEQRTEIGAMPLRGAAVRFHGENALQFPYQKGDDSVTEIHKSGATSTARSASKDKSSPLPGRPRPRSLGQATRTGVGSVPSRGLP